MLIAVDGTESASWRLWDSNSSVYRFYEDYRADPRLKVYFDGPSSGKGLWSVDGIVEQAVAFWRKTEVGGESVDVIGHSRGGLAVICFAKLLLREKGGPTIRFMGLYDAVDRSLASGLNGTIPNNVLSVAHARRKTSVSTWKRGKVAFGNCGVRGGKRYREAFFSATHSAIGGDAWGGDHPKKLTKETDAAGGRKADAFIRGWAAQAGVPVPTG